MRARGRTATGQHGRGGRDGRPRRLPMPRATTPTKRSFSGPTCRRQRTSRQRRLRHRSRRYSAAGGRQLRDTRRRLTSEPGAESMDDEVPSRESSLPAGATRGIALAEQGDRAQTGATAGRLANDPAGVFWRWPDFARAVRRCRSWLGNYLARVWKMPDHAWKISLVLGTLAASILICCVRRVQIRPRPGGRHHADLRAGRSPTAVGRIGHSGPRRRREASQTDSLRRPRVSR